MTIKKALRLVEVEYEKAKSNAWVHNPLAYALYRVWRKADTEPPKEVE